MPSREEIVEWLKVVAEYFDNIETGIVKNIPSKQASAQGKAKWLKRAAQVSAMRCETCEYWRTAIGFIGSCAIEGMPDRCDNDFGCFHHEQKPAG